MFFLISWTVLYWIYKKNIYSTTSPVVHKFMQSFHYLLIYICKVVHNKITI